MWTGVSQFSSAICYGREPSGYETRVFHWSDTQLTVSKALKVTQTTDQSDQSLGLILSMSIIGLLMEGVFLPLCQMSDASTAKSTDKRKVLKWTKCIRLKQTGSKQLTNTVYISRYYISKFPRKHSCRKKYICNKKLYKTIYCKLLMTNRMVYPTPIIFMAFLKDHLQIPLVIFQNLFWKTASLLGKQTQVFLKVRCLCCQPINGVKALNDLHNTSPN